jgi:cytochrome c553
MKISVKTACCLIFGLASLVNSPLYAADAKAGEKKAEQCAGCHGTKGIASNGTYPNLAGQHAMYLSNQLSSFKSGARANPVMQGMAAGLSEADIENLAAYFASLPNTYVNTGVKVAPEVSAKYAMCSGCHGAKGEGRGGFPRLANQNPDYLVNQLHAFKKGTRKGGPMPAMVANLSETDIKDLSVYLSTMKLSK